MRCLLLGFVLLAPASAQAQPTEVRLGDHVRVTTDDGARVWTVVAVGADSLLVTDYRGASTTPVFYQEMDALEVRRTRSRSRDAVKGALIGAGIGAVPIVALLVVEANAPAESMGLLFLGVLVPAAVGTTALGATIGAIGPTEWWERIPTGRRPEGPFALRPVAYGRDGGGLSLAIRL